MLKNKLNVAKNLGKSKLPSGKTEIIEHKGKKIPLDLRKGITALESVLKPLEPLKKMMSNAIKAKGYPVVSTTPFEDIFTEYVNRIANNGEQKLKPNWYKSEAIAKEPLRAFFDESIDTDSLDFDFGAVLDTVIDSAGQVWSTYQQALNMKAKTEAEIQMQRDALIAKQNQEKAAAQQKQTELSRVSAMANGTGVSTTTWVLLAVGVIGLLWFVNR